MVEKIDDLRIYVMTEVFYRRAGEKVSKLFHTKQEADQFRSHIQKVGRRKYLGTRAVELVEL